MIKLLLDLLHRIPRVCLGSQVVDDSDEEETHPGVDIETSCHQNSFLCAGFAPFVEKDCVRKP